MNELIRQYQEKNEKNKKKHTHWSNDGEKLSFGPSLTIFPPYFECKKKKKTEEI